MDEGVGEDLKGRTNRLREIIKKNDGKRLDKMRNKGGASERQR